MSLAVGIHTIPADQYHEDPCEQPSLSASVAHILCTQAPAHARAAHPRFNSYLVRKDEHHFDIGTAVHAILLEGRDAVAVIERDDWRTKDAKAERDYARLNGKIPLLAKHYFDVLAMVEAAQRQLDAHGAKPPLLKDGKPEQTLVWEEDGITCRARLDWLRDDYAAVDDYKSTGRSASPHEFERTLYGVGYDIKAAFYLRGVKALTGVMPVWRWIVQESYAPYELAVVDPGPDVLALGEAKVEYAIATWRRCVESGEWPGYGARVATAEMPVWAEMQWLDRTAA